VIMRRHSRLLRVLWWVALVGAAADLGVALSGVLNPSRSGDTSVWALGVVVCAALVAWLLWPRTTMFGRVMARAAQATPRGRRARKVASWSQVADATPALDEDDQWRHCLDCLRQGLSGQTIAANVLAVHVGRFAVEVFWGGMPPKARSARIR